MSVKRIAHSDVTLTQEAITAWGEIAYRVGVALSQMGVKLEEVEEEELWLNEDDGSLTIKCKAGKLDAEMNVPAGQWKWNN